MKILDVDEFNKIVGKSLEECREEISDSFYRGAKLMIDNVNEMAEETAVEVADRPQGEWKGYEIPSECSVCGHNWDEYVFGQDIWHDGSVPNYCPHCGARMKGADDAI